MKAYEAAKRLDMEPKDFAEQYGLKSHLSKVPESLEAELFGDEKKIMEEQACTQTVDSAQTVVVNEEDCPFTLVQVKLGCLLNGKKSPMWEWRHILDA